MGSEFAEFYYGTYQRLFRTVVLLCASPSEAEDVLQEAYSRALGRWDRVGALDAPEAWVRRVAINAATDQHRRRRRDRAAFPRLLGRATAPGPDASDVPDVVRALRQLPPVQRRVVVLHYLADHSVDAVAAELGLAPGTVKAYLSRARTRLAGLLEEVLEP